jgi:septum formation protein
VQAWRIVLGSASPRRAELLRGAGIEFAIDTPDVDESVAPGTAPEAAARELAERKARAVALRHAGRPVIVIAADTVVAVDGPRGLELLGKPEDERDAERMLRALSGTRHRVVTGVCALECRGFRSRTACERTWVTMRAITDAEVAAYVRSREWEGKAGGYAIQESADRFVTALTEGGFDNVVGLPLALTLQLLEEVRALAGPGVTD